MDWLKKDGTAVGSLSRLSKSWIVSSQGFDDPGSNLALSGVGVQTTEVEHEFDTVGIVCESFSVDYFNFVTHERNT